MTIMLETGCECDTMLFSICPSHISYGRPGCRTLQAFTYADMSKLPYLL